MAVKNESQPAQSTSSLREELLQHHDSHTTDWALKRHQRRRLTHRHIHTPGLLEQQKKDEKTAYHEAGHLRGVSRRNHYRKYASVIPTTEWRGVTTFNFSNKSYEDILKDSIFIASCSLAAEETFEFHDHSGCGGDRAQAKEAAFQLSRYYLVYENKWVDPEELLATGRSEARAEIAADKDWVEYDADELMERREICYN